MVLERAVIAGAGAGDETETCGRRAGEEVDGSSNRVRPVEGGAGAVEDVYAGDGVERDGNVEVEMAGLGIVDA